MEYATNSLYKKKYKKNHFQILKLFGVVYILFPLMAYLSYKKYDTSPDNIIITLIIFAITFIGGHIAVINTIITFNRIANNMVINGSNVIITSKVLFSGKYKQAMLNKDQITISKGEFPWNATKEGIKGIIIRDRKSRDQYYIIEAYFDEYEELVAQLKK